MRSLDRYYEGVCYFLERRVIEYAEQLAQHLPLGVLVFVGTFLEEVLSPIPSFLVLVPAGAAARAQQLPLWHILLLAVICGVARTLGGSILYWIAQKFERLLLGKRQLFGFSHRDIVSLGKRLGSQRTAWRAWLILFALHALPIFPGTLLSAGSGFLRIRFDIFVGATFAGSIVNGVFYLSIGYAGLHTVQLLDDLGFATNIITLILVITLGVWLVLRRRNRPKTPNKKSPDR